MMMALTMGKIPKVMALTNQVELIRPAFSDRIGLL
jgi:hypothetical protein